MLAPGPPASPYSVGCTLAKLGVGLVSSRKSTTSHLKKEKAEGHRQDIFWTAGVILVGGEQGRDVGGLGVLPSKESRSAGGRLWATSQRFQDLSTTGNSLLMSLVLLP